MTKDEMRKEFMYLLSAEDAELESALYDLSQETVFWGDDDDKKRIEKDMRRVTQIKKRAIEMCMRHFCSQQS